MPPASGAGQGFEIAKAFLTVEARLKKESVDAVRREAAQKLANIGRGAPTATPGDMAQPGVRARAAAQRAQVARGVGPQGPAPAVSTGDMAGRERLFADMGRRYGAALRNQFSAALGSLGQIITQRAQGGADAVTSAAQAQTRPRSGAPTSPGAAGGAGRMNAGQSPESIAAEFTQRFATALRKAPIGPMAGGRQQGQVGATNVTNNTYNTQVRIDPRKIDELLHAIKVVNQLKAQNRARPKGAPGFESRNSGATSTLVSGTEQAAIKALSKNSTMLYRLRNGAHNLAAVGLGFMQRISLEGFKIATERRKRVWREERHTRYRPLDKTRRERGPSGKGRRTGSFYYNTKFRGAMYKDFKTLNDNAIASVLTKRLEVARTYGGGGPTEVRANMSALSVQSRFRASTAARGKTSGTPGMYGYVDSEGSSNTGQHHGLLRFKFKPIRGGRGR